MANPELPHLTVQKRPAKQLAARLEGVLAVDEATNCNTVAQVGETIALCGGFVSAERAHASSRMGHARVFAVAEGMLVRRATRGE